MNYLTLCQDFVREFGLAGGTGPAAVTSQTGELQNVTRWIRDACLYIDNLWIDWNYLWAEHRINVLANVTEPDLPAGAVRMWHKKTFCFDRDTDRFELNCLDWKDFTRRIAKPTTAHAVTVRPDGVLVFDGPTAEAVEFYGEYQKEPVALAANNDTPAMPAAFHRLIIMRAGVMYGNREDAPEIISGAETEYIDLLEKLEAVCLPGREYDRLAEYEAEPQAIPGF